MSNEIDYAEQEIPQDKPPEEYSYVERRAEMYRMLEDAGHPRNLGRSQRELGNRYGVSQKQISKDLERLRQYRKERVGDKAVATTEFVAEKAVREAASNGDYAEALQLQLQYNQWLFDLGAIDKEPEKHEITGDPGEAYMEMLREATDDDGGDDS